VTKILHYSQLRRSDDDARIAPSSFPQVLAVRAPSKPRAKAYQLLASATAAHSSRAANDTIGKVQTVE
jgi:hypothetical protein